MDTNMHIGFTTALGSYSQYGESYAASNSRADAEKAIRWAAENAGTINQYNRWVATEGVPYEELLEF